MAMTAAYHASQLVLVVTGVVVCINRLAIFLCSITKLWEDNTTVPPQTAWHHLRTKCMLQHSRGGNIACLHDATCNTKNAFCMEIMRGPIHS